MERTRCLELLMVKKRTILSKGVEAQGANNCIILLEGFSKPVGIMQVCHEKRSFDQNEHDHKACWLQFIEAFKTTCQGSGQIDQVPGYLADFARGEQQTC